jgi:hypothetical protein
MGKVGEALLVYTKNAHLPTSENFLSAGMEAIKAAPSTMGTLLATALMRAGKELPEKPNSLPLMRQPCSMQLYRNSGTRKANLGDKTVLDAIHSG